MYCIDLLNSNILEQCPWKTRNKKIQWLLELFREQAVADDQPCYEPDDIIAILNWLKLTDLDQNEIKSLLAPW